MPDVFVARQPIFDAAQELAGYELLFRGGNENVAVFSDHDEATSTVVVNAFTELGLDRVAGPHRAWINVSRDFVVREMAHALPPDRVVLELLEDQVVDDALLSSIDELRFSGFTVALDDFSWDEQRVPLLERVDYVKVELLGRERDAVKADVARLRAYPAAILAEKVETHEDYEFCAELGIGLFQGYFFCKPEVMSARGVAPNRLALLQLLAALQNPRIEFGRLETLIARDVALSYRLLRYINSAFFGLRCEVSSIGRALTLLGLDNLKRWSTLTVFAGVDDKPRELIVTALVRARFCELAGSAFNCENPDRLFTLGLFSVVDALMDAPMEEVLRSIPFPPAMTEALVNGAGPKGEVLAAARECERGAFPSLQLARLHLDALDWATRAANELFEQPATAAAA
jgi:c-di-GMP phosphodiesterase